VDLGEVGGPHGMFFEEEQDAFYRLRQRVVQFGVSKIWVLVVPVNRPH
jgi:hypothetical protein